MTTTTPGATPAEKARNSEIIQHLIAQAIDYSAAADKARHDDAKEAEHMAAFHATIKALAIVMNADEADAHEAFISALNA